MRNALLAILIFTAVGSCAHGASKTAAASAHLEVTVISASDNRTRIPGAEIVLLDLSGERHLGKTDEFGNIEIDLARPWRAVLICHPLFSCAALRPADVDGFETRTIALAPVVLR
jgi:hypothetical protein